jgi:hypothetical protein
MAVYGWGVSGPAADPTSLPPIVPPADVAANVALGEP